MKKILLIAVLLISCQSFAQKLTKEGNYIVLRDKVTNEIEWATPSKDLRHTYQNVSSYATLAVFFYDGLEQTSRKEGDYEVIALEDENGVAFTKDTLEAFLFEETGNSSGSGVTGLDATQVQALIVENLTLENIVSITQEDINQLSTSVYNWATDVDIRGNRFKVTDDPASTVGITETTVEQGTTKSLYLIGPAVIPTGDLWGGRFNIGTQIDVTNTNGVFSYEVGTRQFSGSGGQTITSYLTTSFDQLTQTASLVDTVNFDYLFTVKEELEEHNPVIFDTDAENKGFSIDSNQVISVPDNLINNQATSGYIDIGDMRMQWGISTGSGTRVVTLPAPFLNSDYTPVTSANLPARIGTWSNRTETQFTVTGQSPAGVNSGSDISWQAIGLKPQ